MPETSEPAGRRANGLSAADWGALVDLDPRLSGGLLDRLAQAGVPAYVEPASAVDTVHRAVTMPARPLDRLWVDPSRADLAREIVANEVAELTALLTEDDPGATAHGLIHPVPRSAAPRVLRPPLLPGPALTPPPSAEAVPAAEKRPAGQSDDDVFAQIVADFHREVHDPHPRWPAAEDLPVQDPLRRRRSDAPRTGPPPTPPAPAPAGHDPAPVPQGEPLPGWLEPEALEDDGHFVPPPPPPVPRVRLRTLAAVVCVTLGLLVLFLPGAVGLGATREVGVLGMALLGGGAAALVWWMRDDGDDDGSGDGAVV